MSTTVHAPHGTRPEKLVAPGVHFTILREHDPLTGHAGTGLTLFVRMEKGAKAVHHVHPGGEETYLISGRLRVGSRVLHPGDYLWTAEGEAHDGFAEEESLFFVVLPNGLRPTGL